MWRSKLQTIQDSRRARSECCRDESLQRTKDNECRRQELLENTLECGTLIVDQYRDRVSKIDHERHRRHYLQSIAMKRTEEKNRLRLEEVAKMRQRHQEKRAEEYRITESKRVKHQKAREERIEEIRKRLSEKHNSKGL